MISKIVKTQIFFIFYPAYTLIAYFGLSSEVSMPPGRSPVRISAEHPGGLFAKLQIQRMRRRERSSELPVRSHTQHVNLPKKYKTIFLELVFTVPKIRILYSQK
jgi:hypothetical protein